MEFIPAREWRLLPKSGSRHNEDPGQSDLRLMPPSKGDASIPPYRMYLIPLKRLAWVSLSIWGGDRQMKEKDQLQMDISRQFILRLRATIGIERDKAKPERPEPGRMEWHLQSSLIGRLRANLSLCKRSKTEMR